MHPLYAFIWRAENANWKGELLNRVHKMQGRRAHCTHCQLSVVQFLSERGLEKNRFYYGLVRDAKKWLKNYLMLLFFGSQICDNTVVTLGLLFLKTSPLEFFSEKVWNSFNDLWRGDGGILDYIQIKNNITFRDKTTTNLWQKCLSLCSDKLYKISVCI